MPPPSVLPPPTKFKIAPIAKTTTNSDSSYKTKTMARAMDTDTGRLWSVDVTSMIDLVRVYDALDQTQSNTTKHGKQDEENKSHYIKTYINKIKNDINYTNSVLPVNKYLVRYSGVHEFVDTKSSNPNPSTHVYVFSELCSGGTLENLLLSLTSSHSHSSLSSSSPTPQSQSRNSTNTSSSSSPLPTELTRQYISQILTGLSHLHASKLWHGGFNGELSTDQIVVCRGGVLKISNYWLGSSGEKKDDFIERKQSRDIRALSQIALRLLCAGSNIDEAETIQLPASARSFMQECLKDHTTAASLLRHPFVNSSANSTLAASSTSTSPSLFRRRSSTASSAGCQSRSPSPSNLLESIHTAPPPRNGLATLRNRSRSCTPPLPSPRPPSPSLSTIYNQTKSQESTPKANNIKSILPPTTTTNGGGFESFSSTFYESSYHGSSDQVLVQGQGKVAQGGFDANAPLRKLTIAQKAFLKNAGGEKKATSSAVDDKPSTFPNKGVDRKISRTKTKTWQNDDDINVYFNGSNDGSSSSSSSESSDRSNDVAEQRERRNEKNRKYELMHMRRGAGLEK